MGYCYHFLSFLGKKHFELIENSGLKSRFLFCLIFQCYLTHRLIYQKPAHFLSAQMALVSTFFQMFIVHGMCNFGSKISSHCFPTFKSRPFGFIPAIQRTGAQQHYGNFLLLHTFQSIHRISQHCQAVLLLQNNENFSLLF